ncbi:hypothetical protein VNO80_33428 [Phaseolus coccineus]|uniref:Senescence-associated protein n=1 Tax=Phaseolus coccineus TaxID=3886 RepID=A0AAN9KX80_PHACN
MIGRADIEGSKSNVAMNAWLPQASYPCGNFSDTSSFKFRRTKGSIGHAFTVRIRTGNQNQTSFYPFVPHEISVLVELILGHLRYLLTDVPPQPNSPPDNVFRPDRPAEADLGSKKRGSAPPPIHGISKITGPKGPVPNPSPDRHATTRSRRGSSSSSPPTADGFGTGTPVPSPQSQSFSRGYGSILPTSLAYIVPSTRGCSPWRPDAVMSTTGRGRHSVLRIFKGRRGRTGHHATCGALPAAGPYLRLSRFQGGQAICTDDRSARAHALGFTATAAPSYSSGLGPCPDGRVSAQLGTVTQLPVHPASPVLLTKNGPLGALDSVARLNRAAVPSYLFKNSPAGSSYPEGNFGGNQLLDGSISLSPLYPSQTNDLHVCSHSNPSQKIRVGRRCNPQGDPTNQLPCALRVYSPVDSHTCQTPWSVFQDGPNGEPTGRRPERARAETRHEARAAVHNRNDDVSTSISTARAWATAAIRVGQCPESIGRTGSHRSTSDRDTSPAPIRFPPDNFKHSLTLFSKSFSSFPRGSGHNGALTLSGAPFQGTWARSATEDASPDYNSNAEGDRFSWWAFPGSLAVTRGILRTEGACGVSKSIMSGVPQPRLVSSVGSSTDIAGDSVPNLLFNQPREGRRALSLMALGATCVQRLDGSRDSAIHTKYRISLRSSSMQEPRYPAGVSVLSGDTGLRPDAPSRPPALSTTHTGGRAPAVVRCSVDFSPRRGQRTAHVAAIRTLHRTIQSACFEHSNFFKVTAPEARPGQLRPGAHRRQKGRPDRCTPEADRSTQPKPFLRLPLRNRTLILRHPSPPWINQVASIRVAPAPARVGRLCSSLPHTRPSHIADRESSKVGSTGNVIAHPRKGGNERDACLTVRCTGHGASQQQHPHYNSHTLAFARPHTTRRFQPVSSAFLLPNTAREDGFDGEATGMSRCLPSGAHVCPQSETHTHDESHIFLPECIRDWVLGWCCVCMAQIFPRSHQARVSTRLTRVVFQLPKIIQADHDAKMVEGEPTQ